ncbi:MAG TPA: AMP-binding protein, partial [Candidatus Dormibacteraeota bacterium]|nr:AMP-binding protein [Candidatus Dormibacteraeota bacterium]
MTSAPPTLDERRVTFAERGRELARRHPDRPAIVFIPGAGEQRTLSYGELDGRANQVARTLRAAGVR